MPEKTLLNANQRSVQPANEQKHINLFSNKNQKNTSIAQQIKHC